MNNPYVSRRLNFLKVMSIFCLLALSASSNAQSSETVKSGKELGVRFSGFNDFNVFYKKGLAENVYRRHRFLLGRLSYENISDGISFNLGYAFGKEKRRYLKEDFGFYSGWELTFAYSLASFSDGFGNRTNQHSLNPSVGLVLGAFLELSPRFILSGEFIPSLTASYLASEDFDNRFTIIGDFNTSQTALSLMYRF